MSDYDDDHFNPEPPFELDGIRYVDPYYIENDGGFTVRKLLEFIDDDEVHKRLTPPCALCTRYNNINDTAKYWPRGVVWTKVISA